MEFVKSFLETSIFRMHENLNRIEICFDKISETELWERTNSSTNSIGNLVSHLNGNITQYILSSLGGKIDSRERDIEFQEGNQLSKEVLLQTHAQVIKESVNVIRKMSATSLEPLRNVQVYRMNGIEIIVHVVEHYSYHTGQIALLVKQFSNCDLGFYKDLDLNKKN